MATYSTDDVIRRMNRVRQTRQYQPQPVPDDLVTELLEVARWTGSSRNTQPWHFVVVTDREQLRGISRLRTPINWVAGAPLAIAIVLDGQDPLSEVYDEGRVTERLLIAAKFLGLRGGVAWFGDESRQRQAGEILGIPEDRLARSVVAIGYSDTSKDPRPNRVTGGRRPLAEVASYGRFGRHAEHER